jgi:dTDP-4-dehydrorhamnose reductase
MRIFVTGCRGQLGTELMRFLPRLGDVVGPDRRTLDLKDSDALRSCIHALRPELIINAAAYTNVDRAEEERDEAFCLNAKVPAIIAEEASKIGALVVHYSTDYVFGGEKKAPYVENDEPRPLNVYGATKLGGEKAIIDANIPYFILRTSWVYGMQGKNFMRTILQIAKTQNELRVVDDQFGAPTWSRSIAKMTLAIIDSCRKGEQLDRSKLDSLMGLYHLTAAGETSWYGFACAILEDFAAFVKQRPDSLLLASQVQRISSGNYAAKAKRPRNSLLSNAKFERTFGVGIPHWRLQLRSVIEEMAHLE